MGIGDLRMRCPVTLTCDMNWKGVVLPSMDGNEDGYAWDSFIRLLKRSPSDYEDTCQR